MKYRIRRSGHRRNVSTWGGAKAEASRDPGPPGPACRRRGTAARRPLTAVERRCDRLPVRGCGERAAARARAVRSRPRVRSTVDTPARAGQRPREPTARHDTASRHHSAQGRAVERSLQRRRARLRQTVRVDLICGARMIPRVHCSGARRVRCGGNRPWSSTGLRLRGPRAGHTAMPLAMPMVSRMRFGCAACGSSLAQPAASS